MRNFGTYIFLLLQFNFKLVKSSFNAQTVQTAKSRLQLMFPGASIADGMPEWLAALDDSIDIQSCFPTIKDGRCYKSKTCRLPTMKFDGKMLPFVLKFCKNPYQIGIHFLRFDVPWWAKVDLEPFIITFQNQKSDGVYTIKSSTTIKARVKFFNISFLKASLYVDGILRYDCTKPKNDWRKRVGYNLKAPNRQYTSIFYKLKIRIEVKKRKWKWFRLYWKCKRCDDVVNESGSYGNGPPTCAADMERPFLK